MQTPGRVDSEPSDGWWYRNGMHDSALRRCDGRKTSVEMQGFSSLILILLLSVDINQSSEARGVLRLSGSSMLLTGHSPFPGDQHSSSSFCSCEGGKSPTEQDDTAERSEGRSSGGIQLSESADSQSSRCGWQEIASKTLMAGGGTRPHDAHLAES